MPPSSPNPSPGPSSGLSPGQVPDLPPDHLPVALLSARDGSEVWHARHAGADLVVRLEAPHGPEVRAELEVLTKVRHPGLVPLTGFGSTPGGRQFIARPFVAGHTLGPADATAGVLLELLAALEALHAAGFVHGDLKPSNVLVQQGPSGAEPHEGSVRLVDFGLAGLAGAGETDQPVGGSLYYVAPERLAGAAASPAADLFAVGVLTHELLVGERRSAARFYADFPRVDFFEAAGTPPERLPEWIRTWVQRLVAVEPGQRFPSALAAARDLAARAGRPAPAGSVRLELDVEPIAPFPRRVAWLAGVRAALAEGRATWLTAPAGEDLAGVARAIRFDAIRAGEAVTYLDLERITAAARSLLEVDESLAAELTDPSRPVLVRASDDPWAQRALELALATWSAAPAAECGALIVLAEDPPRAAREPEWRELPLPQLECGDLEEALADAFEWAPGLDRRAFLERLVVVGGRTAAGVGAALAGLAGVGGVVPGQAAPRVRPGALVQLAERVSGDRRPLEPRPSAVECAWLATLLVEPECRSGGRRVGDLLARGWLVRDGGGGFALARRVVAHLDAALEPRHWRRVHAAVGRRSAPGKAPTDFHERLERELFRGLHALGADAEGAADTLADAWARLRESGAPERVLRHARRAATLLDRQARALPTALLGEEALAELAAGVPERASALVTELEARGASGERRAAALALRLEGRLAELRHEPEHAEAALVRAAELDPAVAGEVAVARVNARFAEGRFDAVEALIDEAARAGVLSERQHDFLRTVRAMVALRRGQGERAAAELGALLERARQLGDRQREAALSVNLATVQRRSNQLDAALATNERAVAAYRAVGYLPGLALAKNQLGGLLRERGELARAADELGEAADLRGRLGDASGQALVRGVLGLLLAERGHAVLALEELSAASGALVGAQAEQFGPLLAARRRELLARLGRDEPDEPVAEQGGARDPRVHLALGREAVLRANRPRATRHLGQALERAEQLGDHASAAEARFVLAHGLDPARRVARTEGDAEHPLVRTDRAVLEHLLAGPAHLDVTGAAALAADLEAHGRDDRAARLWCALAELPGADPAYRASARRAFDRCALGATPPERAALAGALLGLPDPYPTAAERLAGDATPPEEDLEMDIVRLLEINHRLVDQDDLEALLGSIVEEALVVTSAERGYLILEEDGELRLDTARSSRRGGLQESDLEVSGSVVRRCLERMQIERVSDAAEDPLFGGAQSVRDLDLRSILCAPFRVDAAVSGVIYLDNRLRRGAFDARAERLLGLLVDQAALAIGQVRRREEIARLNAELAARIEVRETDLAAAKRQLAEAGLPRPVGGLVGRSAPLQRVKALIERAAPTDLPVLVHGESGTGKELAARALHDLSARSAGPFVTENCAAMPPSLIEAELFGVVRGAFTGAEQDRPGLFERAAGGTLFLDEVGEMPLELQAKLLRALETREVRPVGSSVSRAVDFRLVTATNRELGVEVEAGRFRSDLYYRLRGIEVEMPPLRAVLEDLPELVAHLLAVEARREGAHKPIAPAVLDKLMQRAWPGNVRELGNEVRRLYALSGAAIDDPELVRPAQDGGGSTGSLEGTLAEIEKRAILTALERTGGDKRAAAEALGISRAKVYQRLKDWDEA